MVWFDVKSDQQPDCASIIHHLQTLPLFEVTCMHKDLQNKGKACAGPLDSDSRKLNWRRTVSWWAILNNSRSEVLVEQSCTNCTLFYSLYVELSLLCRFSRQVPLCWWCYRGVFVALPPYNEAFSEESGIPLNCQLLISRQSYG